MPLLPLLRGGVLSLALLLWLGACASLDGTRSVSFSKSELQAALTRGLSRSPSVSSARLEISQPELSLQGATQRIGFGFRLRAPLPRALQSVLRQEALDAHVLMNAGLRFEASDDSLRLVAPELERFETQLLQSPLANAAIEPILKQLISRELADAVVYRFKAEQLTRGSTRYSVERLTVTDTALQIELRPKP